MIPMRRCWLSLFVTIFVLLFLGDMTSWPCNESSGEASVAIGISLTTTYGTASKYHNDGTLEEVTRVDGDGDYLEMMLRLSTQQAAHPAPPYRNMEEMWDDIPRQLWRSARKRFGLAASSDVHRLSVMVQRLYEASLSQVSDARPSTRISYPSLLGLYDEDVLDTIEYLNIKSYRGFYHYEPREAYAAYAGHDMGLCKSYNDREQCRRQGLQMPVRDVLLVEYTKKSLIQHALIMREALDLGDPDVDITATFDLGSDAADSPDYASRVHNEVSNLLCKRHTLKPPNEITVIITGESGGDKDMFELVKNAVEEFGSKAVLHTTNPEFIASKGAAKLAWMAQFLERSDA